MQKRIVKEAQKGGVFFDLGANVGFYSLLAALVTKPRLVCAFEPLPANVDYLRKHIGLNRVTNIKVFEMAISDEVGSASFDTEGTRAMGRIVRHGRFQVETYSLDALLAQDKAPAPDCIKMDIEGGEVRALLGAKECFLRHRPKLFLAVHGRAEHQECSRLLQSWGYEYEYVSPPSEERAEIFARSRAAA